MEPNFLNLEYFFNLAIELFRAMVEAIIAVAIWAQTDTFKLISTIISALLFAGIIVILYKTALLEKGKIEIYETAITKPEESEQRSEKWEGILQKLESENSSDWKVAIIEADSLLDQIMQKSGHEGKDLGERLKSIEPSDFGNLQNVWEAHKLRNRIAHEPGMNLQKRTVERAIYQFEAALKELKYL